MTMSDKQFQSNMMTSYIQIAAVTLLAYWCLSIVAPFINMVLWGLIIAVALYPMHLSLSAKLGGKQKWSATIFVLIALTILIVPTWMLGESSVVGLRQLATGLTEGTFTVQPPNPSVAEWPLIGSTVFDIWTSAAQNLEDTVQKYSPQLKDIGQSIFQFGAGMLVSVLIFVFSILVAGVFLVSGDGGYKVSRGFGRTLSDEHGVELVDMAIATIRSVAKGVLGVAFIQALLSAIGLFIMDVPGAGLWAGVILVLAIMQLPPLVILAPIAIWVFSVNSGLSATIFAIYAFIVSISDSFLKPMFLGRGMDIPMLVILIGAIGGAFTAGFIGLFVGAVVLAVGYQLMIAWMRFEKDEAAEDAATAE